MVSESFGFTGPYICWLCGITWNTWELGLSVNYQIYWGLSKYLDGNSDNRHSFFFQTRKENSGIYGIFQIFPWTQATLTQRQRKFELFNPSQAMLEEQLSFRSRLSSTGKVQQCSLTLWLHNQTSCTCAALQQQRSSTEEQQACSSSSREAEEHLSGMCVA